MSLSTNQRRVSDYRALRSELIDDEVNCQISLVGVTDPDARAAIQAAYTAQSRQKSLAYTTRAFNDELGLFARLINAGEKLETGTLTLEQTCQNAALTALGVYMNAEATSSTTASIALDSAENACYSALVTANRDYEQATLTAENAYATATVSAENTLATGQLSLAQTTLESEYGAYFTALTTACGDLVDATVGGYYTSLVSAVQTAFNSQRSSENTLITTAISKENSFNTSVLGLSTTYATAEINADYAYYNALINSHASELQTALANEQSLIAAEIACYRAFSDAAFTRDSSVVTANADAARRQLTFTESYGNRLLGSLWEGSPGFALRPNTTIQTVSTNPLGVNSATLLDLVPITYITSYMPEIVPDYWSTFNPLNATVLATVTKSAQLDYDAATEAAYATFMTASMTAYSAGVSDELDAARAEVVAELGARSTFNNSVMTALDTANGSYRSAVGASDLSAAIESYQNAYYQTDATLNSSVASAFGTFQIGVRQDRLAGVTSSNPRYSAYASDVTWATQTKLLRDQSVTQYNADQSAYVASVASALKGYGVSVLSSFLTAAGQAFTVNKTHALQTASIGSSLELADYDAEDAKARAYLTAYVDEAIANAAFASARAQNRATAYAQKLGEVENAVSAAKLHGDGRSVVLKSVNESEPGVSLDGLEKLKRQIDRVYATATAADATAKDAKRAAAPTQKFT